MRSANKQKKTWGSSIHAKVQKHTLELSCKNLMDKCFPPCLLSVYNKAEEKPSVKGTVPENFISIVFGKPNCVFHWKHNKQQISWIKLNNSGCDRLLYPYFPSASPRQWTVSQLCLMQHSTTSQIASGHSLMWENAKLKSFEWFIIRTLHKRAFFGAFVYVCGVRGLFHQHST